MADENREKKGQNMRVVRSYKARKESLRPSMEREGKEGTKSWMEVEFKAILSFVFILSFTGEEQHLLFHSNNNHRICGQLPIEQEIKFI